MIKKTLVFCLFALTFMLGFAQSDSIVSRKSLFIIPNASYQQETSVAPGVAGGYYFKSKDLSRISSIAGSAIYTFRHQFMLNLSPRLYFNDNKWYLFSNINFRKYPDYYYGIGNTPTDLKQAFTSRIFSIMAQPQYAVNKNLYVGPYITARFEHVKTDSTFIPNKDHIYNTYGKDGWEPYSAISLGAVATYDTRDNSFYPEYGTFAKMTFAFSQAGWGSTYSVQQVSLDFRKYIPFFANQVLAIQGRADGTFGKNGIPFQILPTLGGRDMLRGFREGKYKQNILFAVQTEYRIPIYKRLKGAAFCSAGDVVDNNNFNIDKLKLAYGVGLRYRLNDARVHLRVDIAKNNYGDKLQFYITASEAF